MNSVVAFCVLLSVAVLANAATPSTPVWPKAFSASVVIDVQNTQRFVRWFEDTTAQQGRLDGVMSINNNPIFTSMFFNHKSGIEYLTYYVGDQVFCHAQKLTRPQYSPVFTTFTYIGESLINLDTVYEWAYRNTTDNAVVAYFDFTDSREPARFTAFQDGNIEQWTFFEFDEGTQDPALFVIPPAVLQICNTPSSSSVKFN